MGENFDKFDDSLVICQNFHLSNFHYNKAIYVAIQRGKILLPIISLDLQICKNFPLSNNYTVQHNKLTMHT